MKFGHLIILFTVIISSAAKSQIVSWASEYSDTTASIALTDAKVDVAGNVLISGSKTPYQVFTINPLLLKYDPAGNLVFEWSRFDSLSFESIRQIEVDSLGDVYLFMRSIKNNVRTMRLIKLDGISGQIQFENSFSNTIFEGSINIDDGGIIIAFGSPQLQLSKFDFSGSQQWNEPVSSAMRISRMITTISSIYIVCDSIVGSNTFVSKILVFDLVGNFLNSFSSTILNTFIDDIESDPQGLIYLTGATDNANGFLIKANSNGIISDSLFGNTQNWINRSSLTRSESGSIYWNYLNSDQTGSYNNIYKIQNGIQLIGIVDSVAENTAPYGTDSRYFMDKQLIVGNEKMVSTFKDYEISAFDTSGFLIWNLDYSMTSNSKENIFKVLTYGNNIYVVGRIVPLAAEGVISLLKIEVPTSTNTVANVFNAINIYPNPSPGKQLKFSENLENATMRFVDMHGKVLLEINNFFGSEVEVPENLSRGIYLIVIQEKERTFSNKLILK